MRPRTACLRCRDLKRKCVFRDNVSECRRCKSMQLECKIGDGEASTRPGTSTGSEDSGCIMRQLQLEHPEDIFPEQSLCDELVDLYFDYLHDKQHSLFHRPSFVANQRKGLAPPMIVAAMMALSARFSNNLLFEGVDPLSRGRGWAEHARRLFYLRPEAVSLTAVQACCILGSISFIEGDTANESLFGAQAIRMIQLLDLPNRLSSNFVQRETEIRVWWTIWMMDNWSSAGAKLPKQLFADPAYPRPLEEVLFETLDDEANLFTDFEPIQDAIQRRNRGLWAQMIPLTEMMSQIVEINESTVQNRSLRSKIFEDVETMGNKLDSWLLRLPRELQLTPENLKQYSDVGHARTLIALHLGFHHHAQVLYYQFLHQNHTDTPAEHIQRAEFATRCKHHALELSALLWLANSTPGWECLWVVTGHLLVISSSVQLHTLLFSDDDIQIESAKATLKQNFEMMLNLRKYWSSLELSMSRLRAFHRACQESMHTSFAMDQWMLIFLQRYMEPISDRVQHALMSDALNLSDWPTPVRDFGSELNYGGDAMDSDSWYDVELLGSASDILQTFL